MPDIFRSDSGFETAYSFYALPQASYEQLPYVLEESAEHHRAAEGDFSACEPAQHLSVAPT